MYKFALGKLLSSAIEKENLSENSFKTLGVKKAKKRFNLTSIASKKLACSIHLKREQCVSQLKMAANKIISFSEAAISTVKLQKTQKLDSELENMETIFFVEQFHFAKTLMIENAH